MIPALRKLAIIIQGTGLVFSMFSDRKLTTGKWGKNYKFRSQVLEDKICRKEHSFVQNVNL